MRTIGEERGGNIEEKLSGPSLLYYIQFYKENVILKFLNFQQYFWQNRNDDMHWSKLQNVCSDLKQSISNFKFVDICLTVKHFSYKSISFLTISNIVQKSKSSVCQAIWLSVRVLAGLNILGLQYNSYVLLRFTMKGSVLNMKCVALILHLHGHSKQCR